MADEHKNKHKKRKPRKIITTRHDDGTYSHEHMHDGGSMNQFAGTSSTMDDLKQHMEDHFGGAAGGPEEAAAGPAAPDAGGMPGE